MEEVDERAAHGEVDALFSRTATDNAEVVSPQTARTSDSLWTVSANRPTAPDQTAPEQTAPDQTAPDQPGPGQTEPGQAAEDSAAGDSDFPQHPPPFGRPYRSPIRGVQAPSAGPSDADDLWSEHIDIDIDIDDDFQDEPGPDPGQVPFDEPNFDHDQYGVGEEDFDDHTRQRSSAPRDSVGSVFRSDPVERNEEFIDHVDDHVEQDPPVDPSARTLFSSGQNAPPPYDTGNTFDPQSGLDYPRSSPVADGPEAGGNYMSEYEEESPGFTASIARLRSNERDRATVPLLVAGALLHEGEAVLGLLVGQMLGRPAVVVLTPQRVLVTNDRPWQPVVDVYPLDENLQVRGRHDRNVAAIGFSDGDGLSMVDGIFDVQSAMDMVARIRRITDDEV